LVRDGGSSVISKETIKAALYGRRGPKGEGEEEGGYKIWRARAASPPPLDSAGEAFTSSSAISRSGEREEALAHVLTSPASSRQRSRSEVSSLPSPDLRARHSLTLHLLAPRSQIQASSLSLGLGIHFFIRW